MRAGLRRLQHGSVPVPVRGGVGRAGGHDLSQRPTRRHRAQGGEPAHRLRPGQLDVHQNHRLSQGGNQKDQDGLRPGAEQAEVRLCSPTKRKKKTSYR